MDATGAIVNVEPRNVDAAAPADTAVNPACTSTTTIDQGSHIHCICTTKNLAKKIARANKDRSGGGGKNDCPPTHLLHSWPGGSARAAGMVARFPQEATDAIAPRSATSSAAVASQ